MSVFPQIKLADVHHRQLLFAVQRRVLFDPRPVVVGSIESVILEILSQIAAVGSVELSDGDFNGFADSFQVIRDGHTNDISFSAVHKDRK